jgi:hypothetical protein
VVAKFDPKDPTSAPEDVREETRHLYAERLDALRKGKGVVQGLRIGIPQVLLSRFIASGVSLIL